nr:MAG TPA: hypothetical protein [Caudoviricetes sp.]DAX28661.1 MAG TPA: hypothetical protein [Caudoviricetes sp.]
MSCPSLFPFCLLQNSEIKRRCANPPVTVSFRLETVTSQVETITDGLF